MKNIIPSILQALREMPGFLWGPRLEVHEDAESVPGLRTLAPLKKLRAWPYRAHKDALGYFARRRVIANPSLLAALALLLTLSGCWNLTGQNQDAALDNAVKYAQQIGGDARVIDCNKHDTDGDGYLSCSIRVNDSLTQVECAGYTLFEMFRNEGCRAPKLNLRTMPTNSGN